MNITMKAHKLDLGTHQYKGAFGKLKAFSTVPDGIAAENLDPDTESEKVTEIDLRYWVGKVAPLILTVI